MKMKRKKREEAVCPHCLKCVAMKTWSLYRFVVLWRDSVGISVRVIFCKSNIR